MSAAEKDRTISLRPGTGARAFSLRTSETPERMRNDQFGWDFEAAGLRADFDLLGRAQRLGENVVAGETEIDQRRRRRRPRRASGARRGRPKARSRARRRRRRRALLGLIVQRRADVLDRVDEVQAGGEQRKVVAGVAGVGTVNWARSSSGPVCAGQIGRAGQKRQWAPRSRRGAAVSASAQAAR